jgi:hypothetical protein
MESKDWIIAAVGIGVIGYIWNKYNFNTYTIVPNSYSSQAGKPLTANSSIPGNTGIAGGSNGAAVTQGQLADVISQVNSVFSEILTPTAASPDKVKGADINTKFTEALKWAKTAMVMVGKSKVSATSVVIATDGQLNFYSLSGTFQRTQPDNATNRTALKNAGYLIF